MGCTVNGLHSEMIKPYIIFHFETIRELFSKARATLAAEYKHLSCSGSSTSRSHELVCFCLCYPRYDGQRAQIHILENGHLLV